MFFFFQAEDGIRDLVRSRGLGDVYKRQVTDGLTQRSPKGSGGIDAGIDSRVFGGSGQPAQPVSYTHLTLPTSDLV